MKATNLYSRVAGVGRRHREAALLTQERRSSARRSAHAATSERRHAQSHGGRRSAHADAVAGRARRSSTAIGRRTGGRRVQRAGDESVQDAGGQQRHDVEDDEVGHVVDEVLAARQRERARPDGTAVVEPLRQRGGQGEPRRAVDDAGRPQAENDAASSTNGVGGLGAHRVTDGDVPEPAQQTALTAPPFHSAATRFKYSYARFDQPPSSLSFQPLHGIPFIGRVRLKQSSTIPRSYCAYVCLTTVTSYS